MYRILTCSFIFYIPATRHLHESCDDSSSCKNSECKGTDRKRSCQCLRGALNGQIECLKGILGNINLKNEIKSAQHSTINLH